MLDWLGRSEFSVPATLQTEEGNILLPGNPEKEVFFVKSCSLEATCNGDFRKLGVPPSTSSAKTKTWQMVVVLTGLVLGFFWELGIQTLTLILHF